MTWPGWIRASAIALLSCGLSAVSCTSSPAGHSASPPASARNTTPGAAGSTGRPGPADVLNGKFKVTGMQFPTATTGYVAVGGFPGDGNRLYDWIERTTDGGRTWTSRAVARGDAAPASGAQVWVNANQAWSSVVSYATHSPVATLYFTTDAGRTWQVEREPFWITDIAVSGGSSWLVAASVSCRAARCPETIYATDHTGGPLARLPAQPPDADEISDLIRVNRNSAVAVLRNRQTIRLATTADAGRSWQPRALPCGRGAFTVQPAASPDGTLYLACTGPSGSTCMSCGPVTIYRSGDLGATWTHEAARGTGRRLCCVTALTATSARQVWLLQVLPDGSGALWRSTDYASTFTRVLDASDTGYLDLLAARNQSVWVIANRPSTRGSAFLVYRSADGAKTWSISQLPVPPGLPSH